MNVELGPEAAQFPEKEYINGIFVTAPVSICMHPCCHSSAAMVSFIHLLMVGSRKARLTLATTRAPAQHAMCGSMSSFQMGVAAGRSYGQATIRYFLQFSEMRNFKKIKFTVVLAYFRKIFRFIENATACIFKNTVGEILSIVLLSQFS